jgi:hypothetical protein
MQPFLPPSKPFLARYLGVKLQLFNVHFLQSKITLNHKTALKCWKFNFGNTFSRSYATDNETMFVFNRKSKRLQKDRAAGLENPSDFDYLRNEIGARLVDRLEDIASHKFPVALDLGSGAGHLVQALQDSRAEVQTLYQMDTSGNSFLI